MRTQRSVPLTALYPLEDRIALSHLIGAALMHSVQPTSPPVSVHQLFLNGTITGTFTTILSSSNAQGFGTTTFFQGSGSVTGLGQVSVTGVLETFVSVTGQKSSIETFTLSTSQGSVTLQLTGSVPEAGAPGTNQSSFTIINPTGVFKGDFGTGIADLKMLTEAIPVIPPTVAKGIFTLTLHSSPPAV
jgi:hypothetical protein